MRIKLITVGRLKESYFKSAAEEYLKRLSRFHKFELIEIPEETKIENPSETEIKKALKAEGEKILKALGKSSYVVSLAIDGSMLSSEELADKINSIQGAGNGEIDFIIGGSHGICEDVLNASDFLLSFSKMTFTYQIARVILLEQIYRASKINSGETYHK